MGCICAKHAAPPDFTALAPDSVHDDANDAHSEAARLWIPDLVCRYAVHLPPNEVPCTLRLVNKATAAQFSKPRHTTILPILPVPPHYFRLCWGAPAVAAAATVARADPSRRPQAAPTPAAPTTSTAGVAGAAAAGAAEAGESGLGYDAASTAAAAPPGQADDVGAAPPAAAGAVDPDVTAAAAAAAAAADLGPGPSVVDSAPQAAPAAPVPAPGPLPPPGAYRGSCGSDLLWLSGRQRAQLLNATAASGVVENLEVLLDPRLAVFFPPGASPLMFAAAAGRADIVLWLRRRGFPWSHSVLTAAIRTGDLEIVKKAVSEKCHWGLATLCAAAASGHTPIYEFLLEKQRRVGWWDKPKFLMGLLEDVAYGCSLEQLKDIRANPPPFGVDWEWAHVTAFAASSPTPDWRDKVEWLEAEGHDKNDAAAQRVVKLFGVDWQRAGGGGVLWGCGWGAGEVISPAWGNAARDEARLAAARIAAAAAAGAAATAAAMRELRHRRPRNASAGPLAGADGVCVTGAAATVARANGGGGGGCGRRDSAGAGAGGGPQLHDMTTYDDLYGYDTDDDELHGGGGGGTGGGSAAATAAEAAAAAVPGAQEAIARLTWLRERGYPIRQSAVVAAAAAGNVAALRFLLTECIPPGRRQNGDHGSNLFGDEGAPAQPHIAGAAAGAPGAAGGVVAAGEPLGFAAPQERIAVQEAAPKAASAGHLSCLKLLHRHGYPVATAGVLEAAVLSGRLLVIAWALEQLLLLLPPPPPHEGDGRRNGGRGGSPAPQQPAAGEQRQGEAAAAAPDAQAGAAGAPGGGVDGGSSGSGEEAAAAAHATPNVDAGAAALPAGTDAAEPAAPPASQPPPQSSQPPPQSSRPQQAADAPATRRPHPLAAALGDQTRAEQTGTTLAVNAVVAGAGQALSGRLLDWLHTRQLLTLQHPSVFTAAAAYGARPALEWCAAHGCTWDVTALEAAARSGSVAAVHWLVARGCPIGKDGVPYVQAAAARHMVTLRTLRQLGVPWRLDGKTFEQAVRSTGDGGRLGGMPRVSVGPTGLRMLRDVGCPIDWAALKVMVKDKRPPPASLYEWRKEELTRFLNEPQSKAMGQRWKAQREGTGGARSGSGGGSKRR